MRVTLDLDYLSRLRIRLVVWILRLLSKVKGENYSPMVRRSASGRGVHLKVHGLRVSFWWSLVIRRLLGDDKMRVHFDLERVRKPKQLLFTEKDGKRAEEWRRAW